MLHCYAITLTLLAKYTPTVVHVIVKFSPCSNFVSLAVFKLSRPVRLLLLHLRFL